MNAQSPLSLDTVTAHHDYEAQQDDELSFQTGDLITVTDHSNADWWMGTKQKDGLSGFFPSNVRIHTCVPFDLSCSPASVSLVCGSCPATKG